MGAPENYSMPILFCTTFDLSLARGALVMSAYIFGDLFTLRDNHRPLKSISEDFSIDRIDNGVVYIPMPAQEAAVINQVEDVQKQAVKGDKNDHQTPQPPKRKSSKLERASMLCSTPPTCIKDRASQVEYTRKEFLGEVYKSYCVS